MKRAASALLVLCSVMWLGAAAEEYDMPPPVRQRLTQALAFFEAFRGAEAACTCSAVTGAKGEALTFARASTQTCTKTVGVKPQAIANGDLVSCPANTPAVMPGADGTGVAGLLVEGAATNSAGRSEELDGALWIPDGIGVAPPTLINNNVAAPQSSPAYSGADNYTFPAVTGAQQSGRAQLLACPASGPAVLSAFIKGTSASGNVDLVINNGTLTGTRCAFTATGWTRCAHTTTTTATRTVAIGNYGTVSGANGALDIAVWGAQCEAGTVPTSYIPTEATTANRVATTATFPTGTATADGTFSMALTLAHNALSNQLSFNQRGFMALYNNTTDWRGRINATTYMSLERSFVGGFQGSIAATGSGRFALFHDTGTSVGVCVNGACQTGSLAGAVTASGYVLQTGFSSQESQPYAYGVVKNVCLDPSPSRCR